MARVTCQLSVSLAWWLRPYLWAVVTFARATGMAPTEAHLHRVIERGTRVRTTEA